MFMSHFHDTTHLNDADDIFAEHFFYAQSLRVKRIKLFLCVCL